MPLLSIVIANYNYGRFLAEAIESVLSQIDFSSSEKLALENRGKVPAGDVELIIIDGGSTDDSVEVVKKYAGGLPPGVERFNPEVDGGDSTQHQPSNLQTSKLSNLQTFKPSNISYWISEPDRGQSHAFNKGFAHAHGKFLTWLNADDVLLPGTIAKLKRAVEKHPSCEWFVGGCFWLDKEMRVLKCFRARSFSEIRFRTGQVSSWGPSSFFTKRILNLVGGVDERCKYTMDGDLWLKFAAIANVRYLPFTNYAWGLRLHECAKMSAHNFAESGESDPNHPKWRQIRHEGEIRREYFTPTAVRTRWNWFRSIRWVAVLLSRLDTMRWRGQYYKECFK